MSQNKPISADETNEQKITVLADLKELLAVSTRHEIVL